MCPVFYIYRCVPHTQLRSPLRVRNSAVLIDEAEYLPMPSKGVLGLHGPLLHLSVSVTDLQITGIELSLRKKEIKKEGMKEE